MNANQVSVVGIILVAIAALAVILGSVPIYALESRYNGRAISGADQFDKAIQLSGIQLMARSKARPKQALGGSLGTASVGANTESKSRVVRQQTPVNQCYNICMSRCQTTPVPVPTTNCASKCSQTCRPKAR
jgi:hypothetical protein